ncbi:MAG: hypothetical protein NTU41_12080 [Chloroflexi bacterium]|nr:hypothetical protein [Chloroflexota bacterium]
MTDQDWVLYCGGYRRAGDLLAEHAMTCGEQHILVYPIVFLYRQYIELQLKEIIRNGNRYLGDAKYSSLGFPDDHGIDRFWTECRTIIERMDEGETSKLTEEERATYACQLDSIEQGVRQFSALDPNSQAFRYPTDKKSNPSISQSALRGIDFRDLRALVQRVGNLLEGISVGVSEYLNAKHRRDSGTQARGGRADVNSRRIT